MSFLVKDRSFYKAISRIAIPMGLQQLLLISVNAVDSFMMGSIGEIEMSAMAICNQVFFVFTLLNYGVCLSGAMLISQYWGKRDTDSIKTVMAMVLRYGVMVAGAFAVIVAVFPEFIMRLYNQDPQVISLGVTYLRIVAVSYILYCISINFMQCYRSIEKPKIVLLSNAITYTLNIGLNYCLVFGALGFPALGISGAAIGTLIARALECGIMVVYCRFFERDIQFRLPDLRRKDPVLRRDFFATAKPVMGHEIVWGFGTTMASMIMGQLSTGAIAAYNVAYLFQQIACALCTGISNSSQVLIGKIIGSGQLNKVKNTSYTFLFIALCQGIFSCVLILLGKGFVISMYNLTPDTASICNDIMYVIAMVAFFYAFETVTLVGLLRGGGDAKTGFVVDSIVMWCIGIPLALLAAFVFKWPPVIVILCLKIDMPLKATAGVVKVLRMKWVKNLTDTKQSEGHATANA